MDSYWSEFTKDYREAPRFQYFPHAHVGTDTFPKMVGVLAKFQGHEWNQDAVMKALRDAHLTSGDGAGGRMIRKAAENLGLFWFDNKILWLTPAGRAIADGAPSKPMFERLLWRYQLSNPVNDGALGFSIYPHHALIEILASVSDYVSRDEFILFVGRVRTRDDIPAVIERVKAWRKLNPIQQDGVIKQLGPEFKRRETDASYALGFHASVSYLDRYTDERGRKGIKFGGTGRGRAINLLAANKHSPIIDFASDGDCIAFYGDTEQVSDQTANIDYLLDTSQYEKAVDAFAKLPMSLRRGMTLKQFKDAVFLEKDLEDYLEKNLGIIEPGLNLIKRQRSTEAGTIDILARSTSGDLVVIELKKVRASDKVFGQLCRYMGCMMKHHAAIGQVTRGYIIGSEIDLKLEYAASVLPAGLVNLRRYKRDPSNGAIFIAA